MMFLVTEIAIVCFLAALLLWCYLMFINREDL